MEAYDIAMVGGGPAGLSAAVYCARAGKRTLVLDKAGAAVEKAHKIENYLGFPQGISGKDFLKSARQQAKRFGAELKQEEVLSAKEEKGRKERVFVITTNKAAYRAAGLIIATGISRKRPAIADIDKFVGKGVSYCVACDGWFFKGKKVAVIGSESFAAKEALELLDYTSDVSIWTNGKEPAIDRGFLGELQKHRIAIRKEKIKAVVGEKVVSGLLLEGGEKVAVDGIFVALGTAGAGDFARELGLEIRGDFIKVDERNRTSVARVYAAGDCTGTAPQLAIAVGEGANAAVNLLAELKGMSRFVQY